MTITYVFHSCFIIENENTAIIIDYFRDSSKAEGAVEKLLENTKKDLYVLSSHAHSDHFNKIVLDWSRNKQVKYIFSKDIYEQYPIMRDDITYLDKLDIFKDNTVFIQAFGSTDAGISFLIKLGDTTIFHAGDLNNWHWNEEVDAEEANGYETHYLQELEILYKEYPEINVVLFPIDPRLGKDYMKGAVQFIDKIKVHSFMPMHFQSYYGKANEFKNIAWEKGINFIEILSKGQRITL